MAGVFHVEFGLNDTDLTQALEAADYSKAERLIKNRTVASYLDEGRYQRVPLYIVLCGLNEDRDVSMPRNLYIARLLIEYGASLNYRVPQTHYGCEYLGPGETALCLLVDFHINISKALQDHGDIDVFSDPVAESFGLQFTSYKHDKGVVVGLNKGLLYEVQDILDDIEVLIFILLSNGADPNLTDKLRRTCLHRVALYGHSVGLLKLLADNGANINATDGRLNTPLLSLCDISQIHNIDQTCEHTCSYCVSREEAPKPVLVKPDFLQYLTSQKDVEINAANSSSHTALFLCALRGDSRACWDLLQAGADPTLRGTVWVSHLGVRRLSPLLVSFISVPIQRSLKWASNKGETRAHALRRFSHLVDAGFFNTKEIADELLAEFPEFTHFRRMGSDLIPLMAGGTTATLKQLAARTIFRTTLIENSSVCVAELMSHGSKKHQDAHPFENGPAMSLDLYRNYILDTVDSDVLLRLLDKLSLPKNALINFEIELFVRRLSILVGECLPLQPYSEDSDSELSIFSDFQSDFEGESDLEYW